MESIDAVLELIQRQLELGELIRQPGGLRVSEDAELATIQARLDARPDDVAAVFHVATTLQRPVRSLGSADLRLARVSHA